MRKIGFILEKEFRQIFRNRGMLPIIFVMPVVQLLILVNAADFEIKNLRITFVNEDHSQSSQRLRGMFEASDHFRVMDDLPDFDAAMELLDLNRTDAVVRIPAHFESDLRRKGETAVSVEINGIDGQAAGLTAFYVQRIVQSFQLRIVQEWLDLPALPGPPLEVQERYWYNPHLEYKNYMLPGLLVVLVTMVGMFLSSMNIVREKEIGTAEQINVSPLRKYQFIVGKLFPFWIIGMFELFFGLLLGKLVYDIPLEGSLITLFAFGGVYLLVVQGIGLLVSTLTHTQQQAMFVSWFFMVIFILMSGLFTPIENMPEWAQSLTTGNPIAYFVKVIRMVLLLGSDFAQVAHYFWIMVAFALGINTLAMLNYRKRA